MQPAVPDDPRDRRAPAGDDGVYYSADDVGAFAQGTPFSRWALARYLVGRAIASSMSQWLLFFCLAWLALGAVAQWVLHVTALAVVFVVFALGALVIRWAVRALLGRFTDAARYAPVQQRLRALVSDTHGDVMKELRRTGLPSHTFTLPLLAIRMVGKRRAETLARLRHFDTDRAVPPARLDELHLLLRGGDLGPGGPIR